MKTVDFIKLDETLQSQNKKIKEFRIIKDENDGSYSFSLFDEVGNKINIQDYVEPKEYKEKFKRLDESVPFMDLIFEVLEYDDVPFWNYCRLNGVLLNRKTKNIILHG